MHIYHPTVPFSLSLHMLGKVHTPCPHTSFILQYSLIQHNSNNKTDRSCFRSRTVSDSKILSYNSFADNHHIGQVTLRSEPIFTQLSVAHTTIGRIISRPLLDHSAHLLTENRPSQAKLPAKPNSSPHPPKSLQTLYYNVQSQHTSMSFLSLALLHVVRTSLCTRLFYRHPLHPLSLSLCFFSLSRTERLT